MSDEAFKKKKKEDQSSKFNKNNTYYKTKLVHIY